MSSDLSSLGRSKLQQSFAKPATFSLHRWVLLKNSISYSPSNSTFHGTSSPTIPELEVSNADSNESKSGDRDGSFDSEEGQWFDSLLENLADDDYEDGEFAVEHPDQDSALPTGGDDEHHLRVYSPEESASATPDRGSAPSMFAGAQNTVINGGQFIASQSTQIVIRTNRPPHGPYCPSPQNIPVSFLLVVPATVPAFHTPSDAQHHVEAKPPPFELVDPYQVYRPVQYEELPILLAPLMLLYLWRFVFGYYHSAAAL